MPLETIFKTTAEQTPYTWQVMASLGFGIAIVGSIISFLGRVFFSWWIAPRPNARLIPINNLGDIISFHLLIENTGRTSLRFPLINIFGLPRDAVSDTGFTCTDRGIWIYKQNGPLLPYGPAVVHNFTVKKENCPENIMVKFFGDDYKPKNVSLHTRNV